MLNMVVFSFSKLKFCIERKSISCLIGSFILNDYSPDSLSSGSSVLLQNSFTVRKSFGEGFFEMGDFIVNISVFWDKASLAKFDQSGLSSKVHHGIRVGHADKSSFWQSSESFKENFFIVRQGSWVYSSDVAWESMGDIVVDFLSSVIFKFDDFWVPAFGFDGFNNREGILSVSVWSFVCSSNWLEDADGSSFLEFFGSNAGAHSPNKIKDFA